MIFYASLFMLHNESINVWSHLIGAIVVILLTIYTTMYISSHKDHLLSININKINSGIKNTAMPIIDMLPNMNNIT
jgi:hypothetical protein